MKKSSTKVKHPKKAGIEEIIMFVFDCVLLFSTIIFLLSPTGFGTLNITNSNAEQTFFVAVAEVIVFAGALLVLAAIGIILFAVLIMCWIAGIIVSLKLVLRKNVIPRWMHISSIVLTLCYFTLILTFVMLLVLG